MKLAKIFLAVALPLTLSAGCALDVGSSADGLTVDTNSDFGINQCGQSVARWLDEDSQWPIDSIVAGDMEFTKPELIQHIDANPGDRSALIAELAAVQLNMAVGRVIPDDVWGEVALADATVMAQDDGVPPPVAIEDFDRIADFNSLVERDCFVDGETTQVTPGRIDVRDNIVAPVPGTQDVRSDLHARF